MMKTPGTDAIARLIAAGQAAKDASEQGDDWKSRCILARALQSALDVLIRQEEELQDFRKRGGLETSGLDRPN